MDSIEAEGRPAPAQGECGATDGYSYCTEPAGHANRVTGPPAVHWDRHTRHEWSDEP